LILPPEFNCPKNDDWRYPLIGPAGFADRVEHKLRAYTLNLLDAQSVDFVIVAAEFSGIGFDRVLRVPRA
jgi:hypothetical protein